MTITGRGIKRLNTSFISKSEARSFGPEWYHPIMRSLAVEWSVGFRTMIRKCHNLRVVLTIYFFEHFVHRFDVIVVQKPGLGVFLVLLEGDPIAICYIHGFAIILAK